MRWGGGREQELGLLFPGHSPAHPEYLSLISVPWPGLPGHAQMLNYNKY